MPLPAVALLVLGAPLALAGTSCLSYLDESDSWHMEFSCLGFTCCGTCHRRYCCQDPRLAISEFQQKLCWVLSPKATAGLAFPAALFLAVAATAACCFLCSCCYLSRRRRQQRGPLAGQQIPMTGLLVQPVYPFPQDPKASRAPPPPGFLCPPGTPPQPPLYPAGPPAYSPAAPPPQLPPQPARPGA